MRQHNNLRVQVEINAKTLIQTCFRWTNHKGEDKWAAIKYERHSDFCYGCGILGHTSQNCNDEVVMSELNPRLPLYGSWLSGVRPRSNTRWYHLEGEAWKTNQNNERDRSRSSWIKHLLWGRQSLPQVAHLGEQGERDTTRGDPQGDK